MRLGAHTSAAGGVDNAAREAIQLGANCLQIFSSSPRQWRASTLDPGAVKRFRELRHKHDLAPCVIHTNYLINMGSSTVDVLRQSMEAFRGEVERALAIGAEYLVLHPGSWKGHPDQESAINVVAASVAVSVRGLDTRGLTLLYEGTAGAGQALGGRLEELALVATQTARLTDLAVGYCLDTCHLLSSGYDIATPAGFKAVAHQIDTVLGFDRIPVIHTSDSKGALGSHVDRHAHIGHGEIGRDGFRRFLRHPKFKKSAFILETPEDDEGNHASNLGTLVSLAAPAIR